MNETRVGADEAGIWREDAPGLRMHFAWLEVTRVTGAKGEGVRHPEVTLEFDHESGHCLATSSAATGFYGLVAAVGRQYDLEDGWFGAVEALELKDPPLVVWQRDDYPSD